MAFALRASLATRPALASRPTASRAAGLPALVRAFCFSFFFVAN
jgi:hypothetical protein